MDDDDLRAAQRLRLRLIGDIVASLAHDFGQPLNIIRLAAENAVDSAGADRRTHAMISQQAERLQDHMARLVHLARGPQDTGLVDPADAVETALARVRTRYAAEDVALDWLRPADCPAIRGAAERLALVLDTALDNACDAVLAARMTRPAGTVRVTCAVIEGAVVISVRDDGPGLPATVAAALLDPRTERPGPRPGIGLMLAAGIVTEMGGEIRIDARLTGTIMTFVLPAA